MRGKVWKRPGKNQEHGGVMNRWISGDELVDKLFGGPPAWQPQQDSAPISQDRRYRRKMARREREAREKVRREAAMFKVYERRREMEIQRRGEQLLRNESEQREAKERDRLSQLLEARREVQERELERQRKEIRAFRLNRSIVILGFAGAVYLKDKEGGYCSVYKVPVHPHFSIDVSAEDISHMVVRGLALPFAQNFGWKLTLKGLDALNELSARDPSFSGCDLDTAWVRDVLGLDRIPLEKILLGEVIWETNSQGNPIRRVVCDQ
jgi:hypothetical protein